MARSLILFDEYTREDVRDVFDPEAPFTRGAGLWGLQGIVQIPQRTASYVFFVSYGRSQGEHQFDEGISAAGILRWQSQPNQTLIDPTIRRLANHDDTTDAIYLFLRTRIREAGQQLPYTYLGTLKYLGHDSEREKPVHFLWQLRNWPIPETVRSRMGLVLDKVDETSPAPVKSSPISVLVSFPAPKQQRTNPEPTRAYRASKRRIPSEAENQALGLEGELLVLEYEKAELNKADRPDLAALVRHVSVEEGDGAGYDIKSFFLDGRAKFIEVKTTSGPKTSDFFLSPNEIAFSKANAEQFELRRLYDYDPQMRSARFFSIFGDIASQLSLTPVQFRVSGLVS